MYNIIKKYDSENFRSSALIYGYGNYSLLWVGIKPVIMKGFWPDYLKIPVYSIPPVNIIK